MLVFLEFVEIDMMMIFFVWSVCDFGFDFFLWVVGIVLDECYVCVDFGIGDVDDV